MQELLQQAMQYHQAGQLDQAESAYRSILDAEPGQPIVMARLGILLGQKHRPADAIPFLSGAINALPNELNLLVQAVQIASQAGETQLSEEWLRHAIRLKPNDAGLMEQLVGVLIGNHKEKEALEVVKEVLKLNPQSANAYNLKGLALSRLGETEKGYKGFQKAVRMNPGQLSAVKNLLTYGKGKKEPLLEQIIPQLEQQVRQPNLPPAAKMNMAYVASMYYDKQKNPGKMFHYLKLGNDINRKSYHYSHDDTVAHFNEMKRVFSAEFIEFAQGKGVEDAAPIFILGMPRSGTTLIEQILSSHSKVEAEGEILDLSNAMDALSGPLFGENSSEQRMATCRKIGEEYISRVRERNQATFFTDKLPYNFIMVGLIAAAMPNAKIIHCTRDAVETCFSVYKQNFVGSHMYKNDLAELGQYYKAYEALMAYWNELLPGRIYEANYERMVDDSENEIPKLVEFCGLEMEAACLGFHKNKRAVRTASVAQVRQPIYKDAKKASHAYQDYLQPLIDVLNG